MAACSSSSPSSSSKLSESSISSSSDWIMDAVVGYLQGDEWNRPIDYFIEDNCIIFQDVSENQHAYMDIFKDYGELVEKLLEKFLHKMEISQRQFAWACSNVTHSRHDIHLFKSVRASTEFLVFKDIMVRTNHRLEQEAATELERGRKLAAQNMKLNASSTKIRNSHSLERRHSDKQIGSRKSIDSDLDTALLESLKYSEEEKLEKALELSMEEKIREDSLVEQDHDNFKIGVTLSLLHLQEQERANRERLWNARSLTEKSNEDKRASVGHYSRHVSVTKGPINGSLSLLPLSVPPTQLMPLNTSANRAPDALPSVGRLRPHAPIATSDTLRDTYSKRTSASKTSSTRTLRARENAQSIVGPTLDLRKNMGNSPLRSISPASPIPSGSLSDNDADNIDSDDIQYCSNDDEEGSSKRKYKKPVTAISNQSSLRKSSDSRSAREAAQDWLSNAKSSLHVDATHEISLSVVNPLSNNQIGRKEFRQNPSPTSNTSPQRSSASSPLQPLLTSEPSNRELLNREEYLKNQRDIIHRSSRKNKTSSVLHNISQ